MRKLPRINMNPLSKMEIPKNGVDYRGKVVLAPMVRSGEMPLRLLSLRYGADLAWGPETVDRSLIGSTRKINPITSAIEFSRFPSNGLKKPELDQKESVIYRIHPVLESRRHIFQIGTSSPELAVQAARMIAGDVAGIDVNAGCPKSFSTSGGMGAALLQTPDILCAILEALVKEVGTPFEIGISVKIRILDTAEKTEILVRRLCKTGITGLTVHCRTTPMRPRQRALRDQLAMIAGVCKENGVACLMNGDVENRDQAIKLIKEYGVDGAMIATAAQSNPSCFRTLEEGGILPWREVVKDYLKITLDVQNRWNNTKFLLGHLIPGKQAAYRLMTQSRDYESVCKALGLAELEERAREVDGSLHLPKQKIELAKIMNPSARAAGGDMGRIGERRRSLSERGIGLMPPALGIRL